MKIQTSVLPYLGKVNIAKENKIITEEKFLIYQNKGIQQESYWMVPNVRYYWILELANHSCPNCTIYVANHCHSFPKFASKTQWIQVGNGQYVSILFTIPIKVDIHSHRFEVYTLVLEKHKNVDLVLGIKNIFK